MAKPSLMKHTLVLTIATLLSKILGSVFRIPLQNIAGDEVLGIFSLVYPVYMVALILSVAGLPLAISKLIAAYDIKERPDDIRDIYVTSKILALSFGFISFSVIYIFKEPLAYMLGGASSERALVISSLTLLIAPYMAVYRGFFQGLGDMVPTAISQVLEQFVRAVLIIILAIVLVQLDYSNDKIAGFIMFGSILGVITSLVYLRLKFQKLKTKPKSQTPYQWQIFKKWAKIVLKISIPIAIGSLTMALFNVVDSLTIPYGLRLAGTAEAQISYHYGIYGRGLALVQIATVFATSIVLPLVPLITKRQAEKDAQGTTRVIEKTHYMSHIISWPAAFGLLALTLPLNLGLFTDTAGSSMLAIIHFSSVFTAFVLVGTGILQGLNKVKTAAFVIIFGVGLKIILNIVLINILDLNGAALSTLIVYFVLMLVNIYFIKKQVSFLFLTKESIKVILSACLMGIIIFLPSLWIDFTSLSRLMAMLYLMIGVSGGAIIYGVLVVKLKAIDSRFIDDIPLLNKFASKL